MYETTAYSLGDGQHIISAFAKDAAGNDERGGNGKLVGSVQQIAQGMTFLAGFAGQGVSGSPYSALKEKILFWL